VTTDREATHYKLMYPSDYVSAADFKGKDVSLTIKHVSVDELPVAGSTKKERRPVVSFGETPKKLVLNKTNAKTIAKLLGVYTSEWIGRRITLYPTMTKFGKEDVECIRVRDRLPKGAAPASSSSATGDGPPPDGHTPAAA
jgi:hypothetical protein